MYRNALIPVTVGDVVRAFFNHYRPNGKTTILRVTKVEERFGYHGPLRTASLIIGIDVQTNQRDAFDQSWVVEVIERAPSCPRRPRQNIFQDSRGYGVAYRNGNMEGDLVLLAAEVLSKVPYFLNRPLDEDKLRWLFRQTRPGLVEERRGWYIVRKKQFVRWVRQNTYRITMRTSELNALATRRNEEVNRMLEEDMDRENERLDDFETSCYDDNDDHSF